MACNSRMDDFTNCGIVSTDRETTRHGNKIEGDNEGVVHLTIDTSVVNHNIHLPICTPHLTSTAVDGDDSGINESADQVSATLQDISVRMRAMSESDRSHFNPRT